MLELSLSLSMTGRGRGGTSFSPVSLFASGEEGFFYDASDMSSVFSDSAGTTPASVAGPVGKLLDLSGNANHLTQATAANQPTLQTGYLDFDGTSDRMTGTLSAAVAQPNTMFLAYKADDTTNIGAGDPDILDVGDGANGRRQLIGFRGGNLIIYAISGLVGSTAENTTAAHIALATFNGASSSVERDGVAAGSGNAGPSSAILGDIIALGSFAGGGELFSGRIFAAGMINRLLTNDEKTNLRAWLNSKAGL